MKLLLIVILLTTVSCGKKTPTSFYTVDPATIGLDSDGDGLLDWDEIEANSDPQMANIDTDLINPDSKITIIDEYKNEKEIQTLKTRSLREALLNKYHQPETIIPLINEVHLNFDHLKDFWIMKTNQLQKAKARIAIDGNNQIIFDDVFNHLTETGLNLKPNISESMIKDVFKKTYRLVISTPKDEIIYHLTPDVSPLDFLSKRHSLTFDQESRVIGIGKEVQLLPHPIKDDYSSDQYFWICVGGRLDLNFKPQLGETYSLIYASLDEIQIHAIEGFFAKDLSSKIFYPKKPSTVKVVVKIPKVKKIFWDDRQESIYWDEGSGDRSRDRHCSYWVRNSRGYQDYVPRTEEELKSVLVLKGAVFKKSTLLQSHADFSVFLIELETNTNEFFFGVVNNETAPFIPVGIHKSECGQRKKLNYQEFPLWKEMTLQYHWLSN